MTYDELDRYGGSELSGSREVAWNGRANDDARHCPLDDHTDKKPSDVAAQTRNDDWCGTQHSAVMLALPWRKDRKRGRKVKEAAEVGEGGEWGDEAVGEAAVGCCCCCLDDSGSHCAMCPSTLAVYT